MDTMQFLQVVVGIATIIGVLIAVANSPVEGRRRLLGWSKNLLVAGLFSFNIWNIADFLQGSGSPSRFEIFGVAVSLVGGLTMFALLFWEYNDYKNRRN